jgi:hypothetical protein
MSLTNGVEMLAADDAQLMADHIVAAYGDEHLWYRLSDAAVARAQAEYSAEANIPLFERFIARTAGAVGPGIGVSAS